MNLKYENQLVREIEEDGTNQRFYTRIKEDNKFIPMGLEKKINIYWFQHFFYWDEVDRYSVSGFTGDWLNVPFPRSKKIYLEDEIVRELKQDSYNWYELVQFINDMLIEQGRFNDIGITSVICDGKELNSQNWSEDRPIRVWWSS